MLEHKGEGKILAGGTALVTYLKERWITSKAVLSVSGIHELNYITYEEEKGLRIGACTNLDTLSNSQLVREKYPVISQAIREVGVPAIRYMATIGGNLCLDTRCIYFNQSDFWRKAHPPCFKRGGKLCYAHGRDGICHAVYQGDLGPVLMALEAKVNIISPTGERLIHLKEFFTGKGETPNVLRPDEIVVEIRIPPTPKNFVSVYQKLRVRKAVDFPLIGIALAIEMRDNGKTLRNIRVVVGAVAPAPLELKLTEETLKGQRPDDGLLEKAAKQAYLEVKPGINIVDNLCMPLDYRRKMVEILLKRGIRQALSLSPTQSPLNQEV